MEITIKVDEGNLVKVQVGDEYRFVEGSEENMVVSSKGEILMRYCKSRGRGVKERNDYYETVIPSQPAGGYLQVYIPVKNALRTVHRIVAETFIEKPKGYGKVEVDHINRNRQDNRVENLRWVTHKENQANLSKFTKRTYWRDITAKDLTTGKIHKFKEFRTMKFFARKHNWGKGWRIPIGHKLEKGGGIAYGFYWTAKTKVIQEFNRP